MEEKSDGKTALLIDGARRVGKSYMAEKTAKSYLPKMKNCPKIYQNLDKNCWKCTTYNGTIDTVVFAYLRNDAKKKSSGAG